MLHFRRFNLTTFYSSCKPYPSWCFVPVSTTASRQHFRSAAGHHAGDTVWPAYNIWSSGLFSSRSDVLELTAQKLAWHVTHTAAVFGRSLKHFFSQSTSVHSASEAFATMRYINWCFTYLLTYLLTFLLLFSHTRTVMRRRSVLHCKRRTTNAFLWFMILLNYELL